MDMILYALLKKEMQDFDYVSGYKIKEVRTMPLANDEETIYIINPNAPIGDEEYDYTPDENGFITFYRDKLIEGQWKIKPSMIDIAPETTDGDINGVIYIESDLSKGDLDLYIVGDVDNYTKESNWDEQKPYIHLVTKNNKLTITSNGFDGDDVDNTATQTIELNGKIKIAYDYYTLAINGIKIGGAVQVVLGKIGSSVKSSIAIKKDVKNYFTLMGYYNYQMLDNDIIDLTRGDA